MQLIEETRAQDILDEYSIKAEQKLDQKEFTKFAKEFFKTDNPKICKDLMSQLNDNQGTSQISG